MRKQIRGYSSLQCSIILLQVGHVSMQLLLFWIATLRCNTSYAITHRHPYEEIVRACCSLKLETEVDIILVLSCQNKPTLDEQFNTSPYENPGNCRCKQEWLKHVRSKVNTPPMQDYHDIAGIGGNLSYYVRNWDDNRVLEKRNTHGLL